MPIRRRVPKKLAMIIKFPYFLKYGNIVPKAAYQVIFCSVYLDFSKS